MLQGSKRYGDSFTDKQRLACSSKGCLNVAEDLILLIRTQQELLELDGRLDDDSFHELLSKASPVWVERMQRIVRKNHARLLTNKVARNYNWKGQKGEMCAFKGLKVQAMIYKAVRKNRGCMEASDKVSAGASQSGDQCFSRQCCFYLSSSFPPSCHPHQRATTPLSVTEKSRDIHVMSTMTAMPPTAAECQYWSHSHSLPTATAGSPDSPCHWLSHAQELSPTYNTSVLLPPFTPLHWQYA
ncbi:uncharacterized protein LOC112575445 isoform X2 [Pomacea canaliculata]|uniref:uncharacterized protein LOC112575445 isoform X2 n=1 Tax=Pomacea canaliculata TaxID=400727 RepID=UPI000D732885|nr:uncharacterized protein LOC112575445 isoform X2 [Pomacea canaliculata]